MKKYLMLLSFLATVAQAAPSKELTPEQVLSAMLVKAPANISINKWQQAPVRLNTSYLKSNAAQSVGDESELSLSFAWNNLENKRYLTGLESNLNQRQLLLLNYQKWQLAGELRLQWNNLNRLLVQKAVQIESMQKLESIFANTRGAFNAREIPRIELLLIENALTEARAQATVLTEEFAIALNSYQELTGQTDWPENWYESIEAQDWVQHPLLKLQELDVNLAEQTFIRDSRSGNESWQTAVVVRHTKGDLLSGDDTAVGLQLSIPIGHSSGSEQAALSQQDMHIQQTTLAQLTRELRNKWFEAQSAVKARAILKSSLTEQASRSKEILAAADAALANNEITLTEWLRLFLQNQETQNQLKLAEINYLAAVAELNQAGGLTW